MELCNRTNRTELHETVTCYLYLFTLPKDAPGKSFESRAYSRAGSPAKLFAPSNAGTYELRYVLNKGNRVLTSVPIKVAPPKP